ncbi:hypothetical protein ACQP1P_13510 [Dactylosporangium sp. CA-052675]|uniref:hypothetical protein n=1 Tax=Dactylosporangium sp. CA-052675 TaxID=3239927 RepID=UPI003D94E124
MSFPSAVAPPPARRVSMWSWPVLAPGVVLLRADGAGVAAGGDPVKGGLGPDKATGAAEIAGGRPDTKDAAPVLAVALSSGALPAQVTIAATGTVG